MTGEELHQARFKLGLSLDELGVMLGMRGDREKTRLTMLQIERGERPVSEAQSRLVRAYLRGYRPKDWPK